MGMICEPGPYGDQSQCIWVSHCHPLTMTMRAVLIVDSKGPVENLYIGEAQTPKPEAGEILVKVRKYLAVEPSSNCGTM